MAVCPPAPPQDQVEAIAGRQVAGSLQAVERRRGEEVEVQLGPRRAAEPQPPAPPLYPRAASGRDLDAQAHPPVEHAHRAQQLGAPGRGVLRQVGARAQGQRVGQPQHARAPAHLGHQDAAVGLVELPGRHEILRGHRQRPAAGGIENAAEHGGGVKARHTQPGDGAVAAHQGRRGAVADQAVLLQRQIAIDRMQGRK